VGLLAAACHREPPPSQFPTAAAALERMRASVECNRGVRAEAALDAYSNGGRVRGTVFYIAAVPDRLRLDVFSPFGAVLSTLTSNGERFTYSDIRDKRFFHGPASACNLARFTGIALPPFVLVELMRGQAPVLVHDSVSARLAWQSGRYEVAIAGKHQATELIALEPRPEDWLKPWQEQRVRVLGVRVEQRGTLLYEAELAGYEPARVAAPIVDPDGLQADVPPSGPACRAELPGRLRVEVPVAERDLVLRNRRVEHNPPLRSDVFSQNTPNGVRPVWLDCREAAIYSGSPSR
jgi:hypothetical protein